MIIQQDLQKCSYQEQATKLVWKSIALQQQAMLLLKQATALLTDQSGLQRQANHQAGRSPEAEAGVLRVSSWSYQDDDDWEEWVAAHVVFAGDA